MDVTPGRPDDLGVRLEWPEDELLKDSTLPSGRGASGADARRRGPSTALALAAPRPRSHVPVAEGLELLARRMETLARAVDGLRTTIASRPAVPSVEAMVQRLEGFGDAVDELRRLRGDVASTLDGRVAHQEQLQAQMAELTRELRSLRRRVSVAAKQRMTVGDEQVEAIAGAVRRALNGGKGSQQSTRRPRRN